MIQYLTVRRLIWSWQLLEFAVLASLYKYGGYSIVAVLCVTLLTMVALRALIIGGLTLYIQLRLSTVRLSAARYLRYWFGEWLAFCVLYFWFQAKPRRRQGHRVVKDHHVILAHGFFCNDGFWFQLKPELERNGYSVSSIELLPAFASIEDFTSILEEEVCRCMSINPAAIVSVVCFSMGGLACRNMPEKIQRLVNVITLYTPHGGTTLANITGYLGSSNGKEMSKASPWIESLNEKTSAFKKAVGIWSSHDTIVIPPALGKPPFHPLMLLGRGHLYASIDKKLHRHVVRLLKHF